MKLIILHSLPQFHKTLQLFHLTHRECLHCLRKLNFSLEKKTISKMIIIPQNNQIFQKLFIEVTKIN